MILPYLIPAILIICGVSNPKSKFVSGLCMIYIFLIIALNTFSPDFAINKWMYDEINLSVWANFEPGSVLIAKIANAVGLDFMQYRMVVSGISVVILLIALNKMTKKIALISAISIIYPCITFASGLRSAIAFSICIYAFSFIMNERKNKKLFIVFSLIAVLFHYSALFNLVYLLWDRPINNRRYLRIILGEIALLVLLRLNIIYEIVIKILPNAKILEWINMGRKESPSILAFGTYAIIIFFSYWIIWNRSIISDERVSSRIISLIRLNILFVPLLALNFTYERAMLFGNYLLFIYVIENANKADTNNRYNWVIKKNDAIVVFSAAIINMTSYFWINNNLYFPLLVNNSLFK